MKLTYDPETDSLYIELQERPGTDAEEVADGVVLDFDADGNVVGIDIEHAPAKVDLTSVNATLLPAGLRRVG